MKDDERLKIYRSLTKRLLHELAYFIDLEFENEEIAFLMDEDSTFRTFRRAFLVLDRDKEKVSQRTFDTMARMVL